ncbi:MAG: aminoacetone oxidase family FAD-binding enzyme [Oscillospiraceae bacterium]|nr:aminoacetone oxidase family FAD-binding enzyme [Oscillospiraceae bacterium]
MLSTQKVYDICVIGAGASGLSAAIAAKRNDPDVSVVLLEEKDRVGQKILVTGNGRCNLSNSNMGIAHYGGEAGRYSELIEENSDDREYFRSLSMIIYEDQEGRMYPYSNQASSVLNAFIRKIDSLDVDTICNFRASRISKVGDVFTIDSEKSGKILARSVVIAIGSPAGKYKFDFPQLLRSAGDKLEPFRPALVPMYVSQDVRQMKGARFKAKVSLCYKENVIAEEKGEVQVGDGYLGGICVMNLSRFVQDRDGYELHIDMAPDISDSELERYFDSIGAESVKISDMLSGLLPKRVGEELVRACCSEPFKRNADDLSEEERGRILKSLREWVFSVRSLGPVNMAQICTGGVCGLNPATLGSDVAEGIHYCGEVVNVDGECGGYNLHWAWVSGITAGTAAVDYIKRTQRG